MLLFHLNVFNHGAELVVCVQLEPLKDGCRHGRRIKIMVFFLWLSLELVDAPIDFEVSRSTHIALNTLPKPCLGAVGHSLNVFISIRHQQLLWYMPSHIAVIVVLLIQAQLGRRHLMQLFLEWPYLSLSKVLIIMDRSVLILEFNLRHIQFVNNVVVRVWVEWFGLYLQLMSHILGVCRVSGLM